MLFYARNMTTKEVIRFVSTSLVGLSIAIGGTRARARYEDDGLIRTIHDASGAVVANAIATVTNTNTAESRPNVVSNSLGQLEVPSLHVGVYTITAQATGFAPARARTSASRWARGNASTSR